MKISLEYLETTNFHFCSALTSDCSSLLRPLQGVCWSICTIKALSPGKEQGKRFCLWG